MTCVKYRIDQTCSLCLVSVSFAVPASLSLIVAVLGILITSCIPDGFSDWKLHFHFIFSVWHHVCFSCDWCIRPAYIVFNSTQACQLKKYAEFRVVISVRQAKTFTAHPNVRPLCSYFSGSKTGSWFPPALSSPVVLGFFLNRRFEFLRKHKRVRDMSM